MIEDSRELAKLKADFKQFFDTKFSRDFLELEKARKKYLLYFWLLLLIAVAVLAIINLSLILFGSRETMFNDNYLGIMYILVAAAIFIIQSPVKRFKKKVKNQVMEKMLGFFGSFRYVYQQNLSDTLLRKTCLFGDYENSEGDDFFDGAYKNTGIKVSEQKLTKTVRTRKGSRQVTVFDGIIIQLDMNKNFKGQTVVKTDRGIFNKFYGISRMENIRLEDVFFEKEFEVYATDQIEARYVLTTGFMERMLKLKEAFRGKNIQFSFLGNKVIIAVKTSQDMFEVSSLFRKIPDYQKISEAFGQFAAVFSIIDILKLDRKTGL